jgi:uncharacterized lipoprotein YmbA
MSEGEAMSAREAMPAKGNTMKRRTPFLFCLAALAASAHLSACSILGEPAPDASRYFVLSSESGTSDAAAVRHPDIHFGLGPVKLPGYLDTQGLVKTGNGVVQYVPNAFWAESLTTGFPRALLFRTGARIGTTHAVAYPWYSTTRVDWKVPVDVLRFEALSDGRAVLVARWSVERTSDGATVAGAQTSCEQPGGADATLIVDAMSRCVDELAAKIAAAVVEADAKAKPRAKKR